MATRVVHFNSATARTETSSAIYGDKVALNFTPDADSTYALLWSGATDSNSAVADLRVRLQHDTASTTLCEIVNESKDTSDVTSVGGVAYATFGASPGSQTFSIEFATESSTLGLQQAHLIAIKLTANDKFATAAATSTTSTSPQTVATIAWTPGSTGDYIIIGSAGVGSGSVGQAAIQLFDGTTTYAACSPLSHEGDTDVRQPWFHAVYASGLSGSQTWSIRYNAVSSGTINISNSFIVAFRVDDWPAVYQAADRARTTTTSTLFVDRTTLTQTTEAGEHVEIAVSVLDRATTTNSLEWQLTRDAATVGVSSLREEELNNAHIPGYTALVSDLSAASHTWKTQFRGESGNTDTGITDSAIIVLQIEEAAGGGVTGTAAATLVASTGSAAGTFTAPAVTGTAVATLAAATGSASGTLTISGTAAGTLAAATGEASGELTIAGTAAGTLAAATADADGALTISGAAVASLQVVTAAAAGWAQVTGTANATLAAVTADASGSVGVNGTAAATLQAATGTAEGTFTALGVSGDGNAVLQAATADATGEFTAQGVTGTGDASLAPATASAVGELVIAGTAAADLQAATAASTGLVEAQGAAAGTLAAATASATAELTISGSAAGVLAAATGSATGTFFEGIVGTAAATLQAATGSATGLVEVVGTADGTLAAATASASGTAEIAEVTGTAAGTFAAATASADGELTIAGTAAGTLQAATGSATGNVIQFQAAAAALLSAATASATGELEIAGTAAGQLDAATGAATGAAEVSGTVVALLRPVTASATAINSTGIPTPDSRTIAVAASDRTIAVAASDRTIEVGASDRVIRVAA